MAISKADLRINKSDYHFVPEFNSETSYHTITQEDAADPGRIVSKYGFNHDMWKVILKFNEVVDPIDELVPGMVLLIPQRGDLQKLKRI